MLPQTTEVKQKWAHKEWNFIGNQAFVHTVPEDSEHTEFCTQANTDFVPLSACKRIIWRQGTVLYIHINIDTVLVDNSQSQWTVRKAEVNRNRMIVIWHEPSILYTCWCWHCPVNGSERGMMGKVNVTHTHARTRTHSHSHTHTHTHWRQQQWNNSDLTGNLIFYARWLGIIILVAVQYGDSPHRHHAASIYSCPLLVSSIVLNSVQTELVVSALLLSQLTWPFYIAWRSYRPSK
jgi:hypothetical protein